MKRIKHLTTLSIAAFLLVGCSAEEMEAYQAEQEAAEAEEAIEVEKLIEIPDLTSMNLADAEDQLDDLELDVDEYDVSEDDKSVWSSSNWEVVEQEPAAGEDVELHTEILLGVQKIEDEEDTEEEAEDDASDTPEPEDEYHAIALATGDSEAQAEPTQGETGDIIFVTFNISDNFTNNMISGGAKTSTLDVLQELSESDIDYERIFIQGHFPMGDEYGNVEDSMVLNAGYDAATVEQINFDNMNRDNIWNIRDAGMVHQEFED